MFGVVNVDRPDSAPSFTEDLEVSDAGGEARAEGESVHMHEVEVVSVLADDGFNGVVDPFGEVITYAGELTRAR